MGPDGTGRDGTGRDGMGPDGAERDGTADSGRHALSACHSTNRTAVTRLNVKPERRMVGSWCFCQLRVYDIVSGRKSLITRTSFQGLSALKQRAQQNVRRSGIKQLVRSPISTRSRSIPPVCLILGAAGHTTSIAAATQVGRWYP